MATKTNTNGRLPPSSATVENIEPVQEEFTNVHQVLALLQKGESLPQSFKASPTLIKDIDRVTKKNTEQGAIELFDAIRKVFPHKTLGEKRWFLVVLSALLQIDPNYVGDLYTYLIGWPCYHLPEDRKKLVRRMREALVKNVAIQGVCKPLEAIYAIASLERAQDRDDTFSRQHWKSGPENLERGEQWLNRIYKNDLSASTGPMDAHKDFLFISKQITYGFYLSDHSILNDVETELVVLSGIMIQNLRDETAWHLRGSRRVGISAEDLEKVQECIRMVAEFGYVTLNKVPNVADIEDQV